MNGERVTLAELNRSVVALTLMVGGFAEWSKERREVALDLLSFAMGHPSDFGKVMEAIKAK